MGKTYDASLFEQAFEILEERRRLNPDNFINYTGRTPAVVGVIRTREFVAVLDEMERPMKKSDKKAAKK